MSGGPASQGLGREARLRSPRDFRRLNRRGRRRVGAHFVAITAPGRSTHRCLGLTVSRKVGNAVARNRVKRSVREWFRTERERLPEGSDLVVVARRGAAELESGQAARELRELFA